MRCAHVADHLAAAYCETCAQCICRECGERSHAGHWLNAYRYVDWSARPRRGLIDELGDLVGDAARALQAGLEEIVPSIGPQRHGVIFGDEDAADDEEKEGPVRKLRRWLGAS
jgi:hypothetical protein